MNRKLVDSQKIKHVRDLSFVFMNVENIRKFDSTKMLCLQMPKTT